MEPLYRGLENRARKHPTFWDVVSNHLTSHYVNERMRVFGKDEHVQHVINTREGLFGVAPGLFQALHNELGYYVGIPKEPERREGYPEALKVVRVHKDHVDELAQELARALVAAEKSWWGVPFWQAPREDVISVMKNKILGLHKRKNSQLLIGPANIV